MLHPIDIKVGKALKKRRSELGVTQQNIADALQITFQQVQKYETGVNRLSAGNLYIVSKLLKVNIEYFFEYDENNQEELWGDLENGSPKQASELVTTYSKIANKNVRKNFISLMEILSNKDGEK